MIADPQAKRRYRRLTPSEWAEVEALWAIGEIGLEALAARFQVSERGIQAHLAKAGVVKGSKARALAAAVREEIYTAALTDKDTLAERAKATREAAYQDAAQIQALVMAQLGQAKVDPESAFRASAAIKALSLAAAALERVHAIRLRALGLENGEPLDTELSTLRIVGLTEDEEAQIRDRHDDEPNGELLDPAPPGRQVEDDDGVIVIA